MSTNSEPHEHSWCVCFGRCNCNLAYCTMCGDDRPMTDAELAQRTAENALVTDERTKK